MDLSEVDMAEAGKREDQHLSLSLNGGVNRTGMEKMSNLAAAGSQLTIFYGGKICVYDSVPPEKAQAIMLIAAAAAAAAATTNNTTGIAKPPVMVSDNVAAAAASPALTRCLSLQSIPMAAGQPQVNPNAALSKLDANPNTALRKLAELPVARRQSLQRFLEKRRDRLVNKAPYVTVKSSEGMETTSMDAAVMEVSTEGKPQL